ncbi:hypothetical protein MATL_G00230480 [Megalops atlanticus]|uniref:Pentraxin (PTX) domain-containing protein n=1 Tax=Megalops atlanticus TaxID=7932 RepID=A0A9D3PDC6_MEGAT|nr:hypothetical protein MATL_G00230480 [Megalops atlanticus]
MSLGPSSGSPGAKYDYGPHPKLVCTPVPADVDPSCFSPGWGAKGAGHGASDHGHHGPGGVGPNSNAWWGMTDEAKTTILHLRETLVQQKETILDQRETIRELTAKLTLCEGFGRNAGGHDDHHGPHLPHHPAPHHPYPPDNGRHSDPHYPLVGHRSDPHHRGKATGGTGDSHGGPNSPERLGRMLQTLKERLENLQSKNTSSSYSNSLRDLLRRKINALEQQLHHHPALHGNGDHHDDDDHHGHHHDYGHHDDHHDDHHDNHHDDHHDHHDHDHHYEHHYDDHHHDDHHDDGHHDNDTDGQGHGPRKSYQKKGPRTASRGLSKLDSMLTHLHHRSSDSAGSRTKPKNPNAFQIGFPMRTNYMYGRIKRTLLNEIFAFTLCLWLKGGAGPGLGTPFSYSVPGQANELVLIEWGNNPMELLVNDKAVTLPLSITDGKWHHLCVTWSTRDGLWEAYQDGVRRGSGENLSTWHHVKPGGIFILGQEQDTLGGRFDATQAFVGEISDLQLWSHVLTSQEIYGLATCGNHMTGDVITWTDSVVELHGGIAKYPFDPCH